MKIYLYSLFDLMFNEFLIYVSATFCEYNINIIEYNIFFYNNIFINILYETCFFIN
jgi:hypothetical protein